MNENKYNHYDLSYAAGKYWLFQLGQSYKKEYVRPINLNEAGAFLFRLVKKGWGREEICACFVEHFSIEERQAREDVADFFISLGNLP